jgi:hypothetical protein
MNGSTGRAGGSDGSTIQNRKMVWRKKTRKKAEQDKRMNCYKVPGEGQVGKAWRHAKQQHIITIICSSPSLP